MSKITKPIMLDETGKEIAAALRKQTALLSAMARESVDTIVSDWKDIHNMVRDGYAADIFRIGDQIIVPWKDVATGDTYEVPLDVVHFGNVTLQNGDVVPGMYLQWHYSLPFGIEFDHPENEVATEAYFLSEYQYYDASTGALLVRGTNYNVGDSIPTSKTYFHSAIYDSTGVITGSGYGRWSHSGIRQFLNSTEGIGAWWKAQHLGDTAPNQLSSKAGFMSGFEEEFLSCLKPVKVSTDFNSGIDVTFDTFFLPSLSQMYAQPISGVDEGEAFDYWKQALGITSPAAWSPSVYDAYITYSIKATASAQSIRLRTRYSYGPGHTQRLTPVGAIGVYDACDVISCAPVCVIC